MSYEAGDAVVGRRLRVTFLYSEFEMASSRFRSIVVRIWPKPDDRFFARQFEYFAHRVLALDTDFHAGFYGFRFNEIGFLLGRFLRCSIGFAFGTSLFAGAELFDLAVDGAVVGRSLLQRIFVLLDFTPHQPCLLFVGL